jgi:hypothetical protein
MSDFKVEFSDSSSSLDEKSSHFTQAGPLNDPSIGQLRDQIKKVMIPLLIKTFQLKLELNKSMSLPSRLQSHKNQRSLEEILEQLRTLDNDLKVLLLWCQSCRSQIDKALSVPEEEQKNTVATPSSAANPAVAKSFNEAVSAQTSFFQQQSAHEKGANALADAPDSSSQRAWWKKLLGN